MKFQTNSHCGSRSSRSCFIQFSRSDFLGSALIIRNRVALTSAWKNTHCTYAYQRRHRGYKSQRGAGGACSRESKFFRLASCIYAMYVHAHLDWKKKIKRNSLARRFMFSRWNKKLISSGWLCLVLFYFLWWHREGLWIIREKFFMRVRFNVSRCSEFYISKYLI